MVEAGQAGNEEGAKKGKADTAADANNPNKASHVLKSVKSAATTAGPQIYSAVMSYQNNPTLKAHAEKGKRAEIDEAINKSQQAGKKIITLRIAFVTHTCFLATQVITDTSPPIDFLGLIADWDEIKTGVEEAFVTVQKL